MHEKIKVGSFWSLKEKGFLHNFDSEIGFCSHRNLKAVLLFMDLSIITPFQMSGAVNVNSQITHAGTQWSSPSAAQGRHGPHSLMLFSLKQEFHHNSVVDILYKLNAGKQETLLTRTQLQK